MPAPITLTFTPRRRMSTPPAPPNSPTESTVSPARVHGIPADPAQRTHREWQSAIVALRFARLAAANADRDEATSHADVEALRAQLAQKTAEKNAAITTKNHAITEMTAAVVAEAAALPGDVAKPLLVQARAEAIWRVEDAIMAASVLTAQEGAAYAAYSQLRADRDMLPVWAGRRAFVPVAEQVVAGLRGAVPCCSGRGGDWRPLGRGRRGGC